MKSHRIIAIRRAVVRSLRHGGMKTAKPRTGPGRSGSGTNIFLICASVLVIGMIAQDCPGQTIIRVKNGYALFDSIAGSWGSGRKIRVFRKINGNDVETGIVKLVQFRDKKAAAKIIREAKSLPIAPGDYALPLGPVASVADAKPSSASSRSLQVERPGRAEGLPGTPSSGLDIDTYFFGIR